MKAMILAAGRGSRLGELTEHTPKALVKVDGRPMLEWIVQRFIDVHVTSFVINACYLKEQVKAFVERDLKKIFPQAEFTISLEDELLDTGGSVKHAAPYLAGESSFFLHNCDVFSDIDLQLLLRSHEESEALSTIAIMNRETNRKILTTPSGRMVGRCDRKLGTETIVKKSAHTETLAKFAFTGIHVLSPTIFEYTKDMPAAFSILDLYLEATRLGDAKIQTVQAPYSYWFDMGSTEKLAKLEKFLSSN